jgi:predicted RNA-binding Zn-ribbon protein involved in translation (DUF1610 family)
MHADVANGSNGDLRVDYSINGRSYTRLWEQMGAMVLETTFNHRGEILAQRALPVGAPIDKMCSALLSEIGAVPHSVEYRTVSLDRKCPSCGSAAIARYAETHRSGSVPIMPMYVCGGCKAESYHLTDEYLTYLVENNHGMFSAAELEQMGRDRDGFIAELRKYVISIFASKKIRSIE